ELRGGEPVGVNHAAGTFHFDQHLVSRLRGGQYRRDLLAQAGDVTAPDVADEVQHEDALALAGRLFAALLLALPGLLLFFQGTPGERRRLERLAHLPVAVIQARDFQARLAGRTLAQG